jgi:glutathione S-transferase
MGTITLYTNHACPFAHRAHIALEELGVEFKEVIIDLDTPREPWYLEINPVCRLHTLFLYNLMGSIDKMNRKA